MFLYLVAYDLQFSYCTNYGPSVVIILLFGSIVELIFFSLPLKLSHSTIFVAQFGFFQITFAFFFTAQVRTLLIFSQLRLYLALLSSVIIAFRAYDLSLFFICHRKLDRAS